MDLDNLYGLSEQVYQQQDDGKQFWYEVIKSKYQESVGAKVNNIVVDGYLKSSTRTLVLDIYGGCLTKNFG